jgi:hypothetical protein|tara:strand:- start:594 stop:1334 length:741 start_codon:yes stop_codon:yes gene_type:complete
MLKFSKEKNAKLKSIKEWSKIKNPKVYSISLLSGFSCSFASDCQTYAIENKITKKRTVLDGKNAKFRCFSAIQESQYTSVYNQRKHNLDSILAIRKDVEKMTSLIMDSLPMNANYIRVHVGGDFVTSEYMLSFYNVARMNPKIKFYAYTKAIGWMQDNEDMRPKNFRMIASYGSKEDHLITKDTISANVVFHPSETTKPIDHNEYYAINDKGSFSLLLHGTQKQGSTGSKALSRMNKENIKYSYSR